MQRIIPLVLLIVLSLMATLIVTAQDDPAPDYEATATAIIREATRNAGTPDSGDSGAVPRDSFAMTATALVADVTATAQASGVDTQVPGSPTFDSQSFDLTATALLQTATALSDRDGVTPNPDGDFEATATALVIEVTRRANGTVPPPPPDDAEALSLTAILTAVVAGIMAIIGGVLAFIRRGNNQ